MAFAEKQNDVLLLVRFGCSHCVVCSLSIDFMFLHLFVRRQQAQLLHVLPVTKYASRQRSEKSRTYVCYPFCVVGLFASFPLFSLSVIHSCVFAGGCICMGFPLHVAFKNIQFKTDETQIDRAFNASTAESQQKHSQAAFILCQMQKHPARCTSNYVFGNHVFQVSKYVFPFAQFFEPRIGHTQCPWGK